jgi:hypothetical protein
MRKTQLDRYRNRLLELRARLTGTIENMLETVLTDAMPVEEHDRIVSEAPEKELVLEQDSPNPTSPRQPIASIRSAIVPIFL